MMPLRAPFPAFQQIHRLPVGVAVVDHDGKIQLRGQLQLLSEAQDLCGPGREVPEEIEADLAVGDHFLVLCHLFERRVGAAVDVLHLVGVDADDGIDAGVAAGDLEGLPAVLHGGAHRDDDLHAGRLRPSDDLVAVAVEGRHFQVGMRVDDPVHPP